MTLEQVADQFEQERSKMTLRERYLAALKARGCKEVSTTSRKFIKLTRLPPAQGFWFLGASGSLRGGLSHTASYPATEAFKLSLLREEEAKRAT